MPMTCIKWVKDVFGRAFRKKAKKMLGSDAWILLATAIVANRDDPSATLEDVIVTVDFYNRIVVTFEEMEGARSNEDRKRV